MCYNEIIMSVFEIILFVVGILLVVGGYAYSKIKDPKRLKAKVPAEYTELIGICKEHVEKDGQFHEKFEVMHGDKTLEYEFPPKDDKEKLIPVDSIEKFYIKESEPDKIKHLSDFGAIVDKNAKLDDKTRKLCYILMGCGLLLIIVTLFMTLF